MSFLTAIWQFFATIFSPLRVFLPISLAAFAAGVSTTLACSDCGCSLSSDWAALGYNIRAGLAAGLRFEYADEAELRAVVEVRGGVHEHGRRIHVAQEALRVAPGLRHDRLGVRSDDDGDDAAYGDRIDRSPRYPAARRVPPAPRPGHRHADRTLGRRRAGVTTENTITLKR